MLKVTVALQTEIACKRLDSGFRTNDHTNAMKPQWAVVTSYPLYAHATMAPDQPGHSRVAVCSPTTSAGSAKAGNNSCS